MEKHKFLRDTLVTIICCFFLNSCCTYENTYETVDETYLPIYKEGYTLIFKSNKGLYDSLFVVNIKKSEKISPNKDYCNTSMHFESISYCLDTISKHIEYCSNAFGIDSPNIIGIFFNGEFYSTDREEKYSIINEIEIENFIYTDVYIMSNSTFNPKKDILYDKKYGIIRYSDSNNTWSLIHKN